MPNPHLDPTPYAEREGYVPPPLAPEVEAITARLDAITADLVSDELRTEVLRRAQAQALHREVATAITGAETATRAALADGNIVEAAREAGKAFDLAQLVPFLPSVALDESIIAASRAQAVAYVQAAQRTVPPLPELSHRLELAAWRSLGPNSMSITPPPSALLTDVEAERAYVAFVARQARVVATSTAFAANVQQLDILQALDSAQGLAAMIVKHADDVRELSEITANANKARARAGIRYIPPSGISTEAIKALQSS